jgi:peptidoglycan/xylan/chitin deacetylase (PgdA/CDA1 family)
MTPKLHVVMYHYVRDLPRTKYPRINAMLTSDFRGQVKDLKASYEMATVDSALAFLRGEYEPKRDICLLTFDDGVKEHWTEVTPVLAEQGIQGVFALITGCIEHGRVAPVHMNHVLMAALEFAEYRKALLEEMGTSDAGVDVDRARQTYVWDTAEVAAFKYFLNFTADPVAKDTAIERMFERKVGPEHEFARELYVSWDEARQMQDAGMVLAGHSHRHRPLALLDDEELASDLGQCRALLDANVRPQQLWPFVYPYGKRETFNGRVIAALRRLGFDHAFATETGPVEVGCDHFSIGRLDCKRVRTLVTA